MAVFPELAQEYENAWVRRCEMQEQSVTAGAPTGFDADQWPTRCETFSKAAATGCGGSDLLYSSRYSGRVDGALERLPEKHHEEALRIARECGDYCAPGEGDAAREGCCPDGLDPDCCPCGGGLPQYMKDDDGDWSNV
ncbi:hypothetical protein [Azohydromonas caseinilytica]|uniref:Uncharacterized protein n=1 Tax=Azohydromonas caseinilytica TaxID=2728836 RepID=A0A848FHQ5_9BURK|nr:hypothetical protein [Azohydromonas caseinilytica]NML17381.1 hypothetical protein [Azohydromonas caseinilytica]